jgi:predicted nucleotidyltransferase
MDMELKMVNFLAGNMDKKVTINEIAKATKEHYSFVHRIINRLSKDGVITKIKAGKAYLCSFNLENEKALILLQLSEIEKRKEFYEKNKELRLVLDDFVALEKSQSKILSVVLFGSYSKGTATKESDIDLLILSRNKPSIGKTIKEIYAKYGREINPIIMTPDEFKKQKDKVLVKEIINSHHVLYGIGNFVRLVFEK